MNELAPLPPMSAAVIENWSDGLTAKMGAFVEHYVRWRNATQAYGHAFDTEASYQVRCNEGHKLLKDPRIQRAIGLRAKIAQDNSGFDVMWLLRRFTDLATADPRELIGLKVGCCRYCYGEGNRYQWREAEYLEALDKAEAAARRDGVDVALPDPGGGFDFNATFPPLPNCPRCHGEGLERFVPRDTDKLSDQGVLLYGGLKVKADGGYEIIMADRAKAAELAGRIVGAFTDKVKISGVLGHMHAIADLRTVDPQEAARAYKAFIGDHLS